MSEVPVLVCTVGARSCALPLGCVVETMRPLPVEPMAHAARGVLGVAVIRGASTVVVDAATVLGQPAGHATRFVTLRAGNRVIALAVQAVRGIEQLPAAMLEELPPLLRDEVAVASIAARDRDVLVLLQASRLLPEEHA